MLWMISFSVLLMGASLFLQKYANLGAKSWKKLFMSPIWLVGVFCALVAFLIYVFILGSERLSIVQPIMSLGIVVAMILSAIFLKEKIRKTDVIGFAMIFVGLILIGGLFGA